MNILAMLVYLKIHQSRSLFGWIAGGLTLSLTALTKSTAQSTAVAIFTHQVLFVLLRPRGKREIPLLIVYWISALVPVLAWYQGFLNGLFFELKKLHQDAFVVGAISFALFIIRRFLPAPFQKKIDFFRAGL